MTAFESLTAGRVRLAVDRTDSRRAWILASESADLKVVTDKFIRFLSRVSMHTAQHAEQDTVTM